MDLLVDGMVYRVWLRMSFTGEGRGQRSNRVVKATREDGAEEYGVIYVFENVFRRGGISNWTARLQLMPDVLVILQQKSAGVSTTKEKKRRDRMKK